MAGWVAAGKGSTAMDGIVHQHRPSDNRLGQHWAAPALAAFANLSGSQFSRHAATNAKILCPCGLGAFA